MAVGRVRRGAAISAASVVAWDDARPIVAAGDAVDLLLLDSANDSGRGVGSGLGNHRRAMDDVLDSLHARALITAVGFYWLPAKGTYGLAYGLNVPAWFQRCSVDFDALRSGARTVVTWRGAEGLIAFPSFHAIWAVLLAAAFYRRGWIFWPIAALNLLVIASTITTGMHYFTDVLAGLAISALVIVARRERPLARARVRPPIGGQARRQPKHRRP